MNEDDVLLVGGAFATAGILSAEHWGPWWRELDPPEAYILGTLAIWLGQGVHGRFDRRWLRNGIIAAIGGAVVIGAYYLDGKRRARTRAQVAGGQPRNGPSRAG